MIKIKKKILSLVMTAAMITTLFAGLTISASAAVGEYTVTFNSSTGVTVQVDSTTVTSSTTASDGTLNFTTVPVSGYTLESVTVPDGSTAVITENSTNNYTISNVEENTTVTVIATRPYSGQTSADYYTISTLAQLNTLVSTVNAGTTYSGSTFMLTADISIAAASWTPIGTSSAPFSGTFDGNGKTITWSGTASENDTASDYYGILGQSTGTVKNLTTSGSLTVTGSHDYISPVVGFNAGTINNVTNAASLTAGSAFNIGGIAGYNTGYVLNSSNSGVINGYRKVGGIVGENDGTINSCSNTNTVTGTYNRKNGTGGIAGLNGDKDTPTQTGHIWNCYNTADISGSNGSWVGGICGFENALSDCVNCYNTGALTGYAYRDNISGNTEGANYNCYGLSVSVTNAQHYDNAILIPTDTITTMESDAFLDALRFNAVDYWDRDYSLPFLTNVATTSSTSPASGVTISMYSSPFQTTYNAGDIFSDAGMVIRATGADGSVTQVTDYTISKTTALATTDTSIVISGTYNGTSFSFTVAITVTDPSTIYLNTAASNNGDGSADSPYNILSSALNAANAGDKIALMNTVTLDSTVTMNNNVTFVRASNFNGTMFEVNPGTGNLVRLTTMRIDGTGIVDGTETPIGTLFNVTSGTLNLRGGIILKNCEIGVNVGSNGTLEVNKALISANTNSIVNAGTLIIDNYGGTTINGTLFVDTDSTFNYGGSGIASGQVVYLNNTSGNSDAYITLTAVPRATVTVQSANPFDGERVASSADSESAADQFAVNNSGFEIDYVLGYVTLAAIS